jgi:hypothetical protein
MPPTATLDDIKAYQDKVEKNQITPDNYLYAPVAKLTHLYLSFMLSGKGVFW